jgi:outer membrane receptor protein involved in Fe transport
MRLGSYWSATSSTLALAAATIGTPAYAQIPAQQTEQTETQAQPPQNEPAAAATEMAATEQTEETIVITGTRTTSGFTTPTPVTVQTAEQLTTSAPGTLADGLNQLPQFRGSDVPQAGGVSANGAAGANLLNLRNLGANRNLILLDGRRIVPGTESGATDINTLPQSLVQRVEVVTGGASAAYGSDAVAGVVNFILDTHFTGLKAGLQGGVSTYGDSEHVKGYLTGGTSFASGRGHVVGSVEYYKNSGIGPYDTNRDWNKRGSGLLPNSDPALGPARIIVADGATVSAATFGGLITSGPLAGTQFLPGGDPAPFEFGTLRSSSFMLGGDGIRNDRNISAGTERTTLYGRADYDLTDSLNLFAEFNYGKSTSNWDQYYNYSYSTASATIFADNAFLTDAARQAMVDAGVSSFKLGRIHSEMMIKAENKKELWRGVVGFRATPGAWTIDGYYTHGENNIRISNFDVLNNNRYYAAIDAVVDGSGNIVCRSTLMGFDPDCVPFNPFGAGSPSAAAIDYVTGDEWRNLKLVQDAAALTLSRDLFALWASPLSIAAGVEYRRESADQTVSPNTQEIVDFSHIRGGPAGLDKKKGPFIVGNPNPLAGSFHIKEAFAELGAPIVEHRPGFESLELNAAIRAADYSTSGWVVTWKLGASYMPTSDIRFRATRSRDIRGPNVSELFTGGSQGIGTARHPLTGATVDVTTLTRGNPELKPEKADTLTAGVVLTPRFFPGFRASADYYAIDIKGAISSLGRQETFDECFLRNNPIACNNIELVAGTNYRVDLPFLNLDLLRLRGLDLETEYRTRLLGGDVRFSALANYQWKFERTPPSGEAINRAGEVGLSENPKWKANLTATYDRGPFQLFIKERYIGPGKYDVTFVEGVDINDNTIPSVWYTDVSVKYRFAALNGGEIYATVNNLFNKTPPLAPQVSGTHLSWSNYSLYDAIGRYFTAGVRIKF